MTPKIERLAKELVSLRLKYSDTEFSQAVGLIGDGKLFEPLLAAVQVARDKTRGSKKSVAKRQAVRREPTADDLNTMVHDDPEMSEFVRRYLARDVLDRGNDNRAFADLLGIPLPKRYPPRTVLARLFVDELLKKTVEARSAILSQLNNGASRSSLALWSDVILRGNPRNR